MRQFKLYERGAHWCSEADYGAIVDVVERLRPRTVLEFGPGWSTLALIEGGAGQVTTCEDDPHWADVWTRRLGPHADQVLFIGYNRMEPFVVSALGDQRFDLGLVDGPREKIDRRPVIRFCLDRCDAVLVPLECMGGDLTLIDYVLTFKERWHIDITETGPLAGAYALMTKR